MIEAVTEDWKTAPVSDQIRGAISLLEMQTLRAGDITPESLAAVMDQGLDWDAIEQVVNVGFHFNFINRIADAFDFPPPTSSQKKKQAKMLTFMARSAFFSKKSDPSWVVGEDGKPRPVELESARNQIFSAAGSTEAQLRKAVESYTAMKCQGDRPDLEMELSPEQVDYLDTLSLYAYRITDDQIEQLRGSGMSDRQIFEITYAGALGASMPAVESVYLLLHETSLVDPS